MAPFSFREFLGELKRRHVFKVLAAYLAVAFIVLQVVSMVEPALHLPGWTMTLMIVLAVAGLPVAVVLAWAYEMTPEGLLRAEEPAESAGASEAEAAPEKSIAVLPFADLTGDRENQYFADGITEELIASLGSVGELKVISRTSVLQYREARQNLRDIAAALRVRTILEGSVRRHGDRVRIVAQLIDARTDAHLWGEKYDRRIEDIFAIQEEVARRITEALNVALGFGSGGRAARRPTEDVAAYDQYLRGRHLWNLRSPDAIARSVKMFEAAIESDPGFALAHSSLADALVTLGIYGVREPIEVMGRAQAEVARALTLDPRLAEALATRGCIRALHDWDWKGAETDFGRAVALSPNYETAHQWYAMHVLLPLGKYAEARAALERARTVAPFSAPVAASLGVLSYHEGRPDQALQELAWLLEMQPDYGLAHAFIGLSREALGDTEGAEAALRRAVELSGGSPDTRASLAYLLARTGREPGARAELEALRELAATRYVSPVVFAMIHAGLGAGEDALAALQDAAEVKAVDLIWVAVRPAFESLREEPGFHELLERMGLAPVAGQLAPPVGRMA